MRTIKGDVSYALVGELKEQTLYETIDEVVAAFPNISDDEIATIRSTIRRGSSNLIGWVKQESFTDENPTFIQVYSWENIKFTDGKTYK